MAGGVSREAEKEPKLAQQGAHMEEKQEKHGSQVHRKLMMETDTYESISPEARGTSSYASFHVTQLKLRMDRVT